MSTVQQKLDVLLVDVSGPRIVDELAELTRLCVHAAKKKRRRSFEEAYVHLVAARDALAASEDEETNLCAASKARLGSP